MENFSTFFLFLVDDRLFSAVYIYGKVITTLFGEDSDSYVTKEKR